MRRPQVNYCLKSAAAALLAITAIVAFTSFEVHAAATGPLRVLPANPRYFTDGSGNAVYLTGSHTWNDFLDRGTTNPPPIFDYNAYLNFLNSQNHNFFRLWSWENPRWAPWTNGDFYAGPLPYARPGPGLANDGAPKFDLNTFNQAYFDRLRQRVIAAGNQGIYVSVMLFQGWSVGPKGSATGNPWVSHPFNGANNINGIDGSDANGDGFGFDSQTLNNPQVLALREAYVRKVVDTVNDLDNVLYEISNEGDVTSTQWQYHMIDLIHNYEAGKPKQHPVGMTTCWAPNPNADVYNSHADWVSPCNDGSANYQGNPPPATGAKVSITDTDHIFGEGGDANWVWQMFTRGHNVLYMEGMGGSGISGAEGDANVNQVESARAAMGQTRAYAQKMNLAGMTPRGDLADTGYCLANPGSEYIVYQSGGGGFNVNLSAGTYSVEWCNPWSNAVTEAGAVSVGSGNFFFNPPFGGQAVLYLKSGGTQQSEAPYGGTPWPIPGQIEAENYDTGGEGVAYNDTTSGNSGGAYRQDDVDIRACSDTGGGYQVGWIAAGEWLNYTVNIASAGTYTFTARTAAGASGGAIHVEVDGSNLTGTINIPYSGSYDTWQDVTANLSLPAGQHILRIAIEAPGFDMNYFKFAAAVASEAPYGGTAWPIPGQIEAENYDIGGEGVAYNDTTSGNSGGAYRQDDVDIRACSDTGGGYQVGWTAAGEWLNYTVNVASAGTYTFTARTAAGATGGAIHVEVDGSNLTGSINIPYSGSYDTWQNVTANLSLPAGQHILRIAIEAPGFDMNYFNFSAANTSSASFYTGINLDGPAVTIEGNLWSSYSDALNNGFSSSNATTGSGSYNYALNPTPDSDTLLMLESALWRQAAPFSIAQTLPNGSYQVYLWCTENYQSNFRSINVSMQGNLVDSDFGDLSFGAWKKYGPYGVTVSNGVLNIDFNPNRGDPAVMGLAIFSAPASPAQTSAASVSETPGLQITSPVSAQVNGLNVAFTVGAVSPNGGALSYSWDFGDGTAGSGASVTHAYAAAGTYTATVTVSDGQSAPATASVTFSVSTAIDLGAVKANKAFKLKLPLPSGVPSGGKFRTIATGLPKGVRVSGAFMGGRPKIAGTYSITLQFTLNSTHAAGSKKRSNPVAVVKQIYTLTVNP